jgi:CDP-diacylglycerol--serine O-phosphatidyltransferase
MSHAITALWLMLPTVVSGVVHMVVVTRDWLPWARRPIAVRLFGANKTWRGFIVMPLVTALATLLLALVEPDTALLTVRLGAGSPLLLGFVVGLGYVVAELPNSWMKRRMGIAPGALPGRRAALFAFIDQADSALGCAIACALLRRMPLMTFVLFVAIGPAVKVSVLHALYLARLRKRPL